MMQILILRLLILNCLSRNIVDKKRYMVCVLCSLDAAANDIIEICADNHFLNDLNFYGTREYAQWDGGVKRKEESMSLE